jgi:MFS family permease
MGDQSKATRLLSYGLVVMTVTHTLTHIFGDVHTSIFSLLRDEFSLSLQQLGIIAAIPPLSQALFAIPTGLLSDRYGSKKMILVSFTIAVLGAVLASKANNPLVFILAVSMLYINNTIYHPASYSYTANIFSPKDRPKAMGIHGAGNTLGHAIGPLSVSILIGMYAFGWRQVYLILAVPIVLGIVMVLFLKDEGPSKPKTSDSPTGEGSGIRELFTPNMLSFLTFRTLASMGGSMISSFFVLYLMDVRGMGLALASLIFSSRQFTGLIAAPLGGIMASRYGEKRWLLLAAGVGYVSFALSFFSTNLVFFVGFFLLYGFCNTLSGPARTSLMARLTPGARRGLGYSLFFLPNAIIGAISPIIAGIIADLYGFNIVFYIAMVAFALAWSIIKFRIKVAQES